MELWLIPTCLCMCVSILSAPPSEPAHWMQFLWLLQLPGLVKSSWILELAGPTSPFGSARNLSGSWCVQDKERRREDEKGTQEKNLPSAGYQGCPQQVIL